MMTVEQDQLVPNGDIARRHLRLARIAPQKKHAP
jgi:hypothetical protein